MLSDDERATLEAAYRRHGTDLWRAIVAFTGGNRAIADDAVAHAFIEAGVGMRRIQDLRAWVYAVAFRAAAAELRRIRLGTAPEGLALQADGGGVDGASPRLLETLDLARGLSPRQRGAFVLRDLMGCSTAEAARLLGTSEAAVRVHLHGARRRLRAGIEEAERT